jgi:hypothetical protein
MLGFSLLHRDASRIELLHAQSGTTFSFPLADGKLSDKYTATDDLSENYPSRLNIDDHAAVEKLAAVARMAASLHLPTEPSQVIALLPPPGDDKGLST